MFTPRKAAAIVVAAAGLLVLPAVASADRFVNQASSSPTAADNSCTTAAYATVQSAVNAANPGEKVYLCGTAPYLESVLVQKNLQLTGDPGAAIKAPANSRVPGTFFSSQNLQTPNSVLTLIGNINVQVNGLIIEGPFQNLSCGYPTFPFQTDDDYGVLIIAGAKAQMNGDQVLMAGPSDPAAEGCQFGVGIQAGRRYWPNTTGANPDGSVPPDHLNIVNFVGQLQTQNTSVATYAKNGITIDGPGSQGQLQTTTVDGGGQTSMVARNGVQISRGAIGQVQSSSINNNEYTGPGGSASSTGVLVFGGCGDPLDTHVQVSNNTMTNNDTGVSLSEFDPTCSTAPATPTQNEVQGNVISKNDGESNRSPFTDEFGNSYVGYQVGVADTGNQDQVHDNKITGAPDGTAFGPQVMPAGPIGPGAVLAPIDIQTFPPINSQEHGDIYNGSPTHPPYPGEPGAPQ